MPELPEVETIRLDLDREIVGRSVDLVEISGVRTVRRHAPTLVAQQLSGRRVQGTRRKGKFLLVDFEGEVTLAAHLRMSGQLLWTTNFELPVVKHTHARIRFDGIEELRFVDPRTFGELWVTTPDVPEIAHLGPDALTELTNWQVLRDAFGKRRSALKVVLLNQEVVAGIGNIYADEILWQARLRSDRPADQITNDAFKRLAAATQAVLSDAVAARGSSLRDQQYVDLYGVTGAAQRKHNVHDREGEACFRCHSMIRKIVLGGRSAYFCAPLPAVVHGSRYFHTPIDREALVGGGSL